MRHSSFAAAAASLALLGGLLLTSAGCGLDQDGSADLIGGDDGSVSTQDGPDSSIFSNDGSFAPDSTTGEGGSNDDAPDSNGNPDTNGPDANVIDTGADTCGTVEVCGNGVDDNCNGKTDCADPACGPTWTCEQTPPGWTVVEYELNGNDQCSTGYQGKTTVVEGPSAPGNSCACPTCNVTNQGSCSLSGDVDGIGACDAPFGPFPSNGACTKFPTTLFSSGYTTNGNSTAQASVSWSGGTCTAPPPSATGAPTFAGNGTYCAQAPSAAAGCMTGQVCAPVATGSFKVCIEQANDVACPPNGGGFNWTKFPVGSGANPITCNSCTCSVINGMCNNATETIWVDNGCGSVAANISTTITLDGKCDKINDGSGHTYTAYEFSATPTASCNQTGGGSQPVTLAGQSTICCSE